MIAQILDTSTLEKVILYSLIAGVGISGVFALGVSSAAGLVDAVRRRRNLATIAWGVTTVACLAASVGAIALGVAVMASK